MKDRPPEKKLLKRSGFYALNLAFSFGVRYNKTMDGWLCRQMGHKIIILLHNKHMSTARATAK